MVTLHSMKRHAGFLAHKPGSEARKQLVSILDPVLWIPSPSLSLPTHPAHAPDAHPLPVTHTYSLRPHPPILGTLMYEAVPKGDSVVKKIVTSILTYFEAAIFLVAPINGNEYCSHMRK